MPFDPALPVNNASVVATELRAQFNGLFDLLQAVPVGPPGPQGVPGPAGTSVTGAAVDSVTTVNPWDAATASASFDGTNVHFAFGLPRGNDGAQGPVGNNGNDGLTGPQGPAGPQGPPFTSFVVDGVTQLEPGQPATVTAGFDGTSVRFSFGIPRGHDGPQGTAGTNGNDGAQGSQGPPGPPFGNFVVDSVNTLDPGQPATVQTSFDGTNIHFTFGIPRGNDGPPGPMGAPGAPGPSDLSGTSNNSNSVAPLGLVVSDPPTQAEMQSLAAKMDELIAALRRV